MAAELQSLAQQLNVADGDEEAWKQEYWDGCDCSQEGRIQDDIAHHRTPFCRIECVCVRMRLQQDKR